MKTKRKRRHWRNGYKKPDGILALVAAFRAELGRTLGKKIASRQAVAEYLRVSPGSVFNWEHGTEPSKRTLESIHAALTDLRKRGAGAPGAVTPDRLAAMAHAIHVSGGVEAAKLVFERAVACLAGNGS